MASAGRDEFVRLWRPEPGSPARELRHPAGVSALAFHPDGRLFTLSQDGQLWGWDPAVPRCLGSLPARAPLGCLAVGAGGRLIGTGGANGRIHLHDLTRGSLSQVRDADEPAVTCVAIAPDGRQLVGGGRTGPLHLWELETDVVRLLVGHQGAVRRVLFTAGGDALFSGGADGTAREWEARTGAPRQAFTHRGGVRDLAVSPDGRLLATAGDDGLVQLWSRAPGRHLATLRGHQGAATSVAFNATGQRLVSGGVDGTLRVWDVGGLRAVAGPEAMPASGAGAPLAPAAPPVPRATP
ncbi:MAG: WD40 repeat domain-containing protein [Candidatus Sericytochromatia bacterium]|nr:WD40 repeat domain-containing protein [Candidatus Sericytochromatia bacterium]